MDTRIAAAVVIEETFPNKSGTGTTIDVSKFIIHLIHLWPALKADINPKNEKTGCIFVHTFISQSHN